MNKAKTTSLLNLWQKTWEDFIREEKLNKKILQPYIYESWKRAKKMKIDAYLKKMSMVDEEEFKFIKEKNKTILEIIKPLMADLFESIKFLGFMMAVYDKNSYCLEMLGDERIRGYSALLNIKPGVNMAEEMAGTNDVALANLYNEVIGMKGYEYYCEIMHKYRSASCPIHNTKGEIVAILSLTGTREVSLPLNIRGMIKAAALMTENVLKAMEMKNELIISNHLRQTIIESIPQGIIVYNEQGEIIEINSFALKLLNYSHKDELLNIIHLMASIDEISFFKEKKEIENKEIEFQAKHQKIRCLADIKNIRDKEKTIGQIISFKPLSAVGKLITMMTGHRASYTFTDIIGKSKVMEEIKKIAKIAAHTTSNFLIQGESGTGKELFAHAIHNESPRRNHPFIAVNCAAIPKDLIESELFGYVEGAFTGAKKGGLLGKFELANNGTIFLDEIGDMSLDIQSKLLRVLQNKEIYRIGDSRSINVDVRIISATNKNLLEMVENNVFREELYYRINVITIHIPFLNERKEDIDILIEYFIKKLNRSLDKNIYGLEEDVKIFFNTYTWPGNVRELENVLEYAITVGDTSCISFSDLPVRLKNIKYKMDKDRGFLLEKELKGTEESAKKLYLQALNVADGKIEEAAKILKVSRATLYRKLKKYGIK